MGVGGKQPAFTAISKEGCVLLRELQHLRSSCMLNSPRQYICRMGPALCSPVRNIGKQVYSKPSAAYCIGDPPAGQLDTAAKSEALHGLYVSEYPAGPNAEREDRPTTWFVGVHNALNTSDALAGFQAAVAAPPKRSKSDPVVREQPERRGK